MCHSVECYQGNKLVGGLYGVSIGAAFFGESMFSKESNASKIALVHLVDRLRHGNFILLDTQFVTPHLASLGAKEIPRGSYLDRLKIAVGREANFCNPCEVQSLRTNSYSFAMFLSMIFIAISFFIFSPANTPTWAMVTSLGFLLFLFMARDHTFVQSSFIMSLL